MPDLSSSNDEYKAGDVVETVYGVGVIVQARSSDWVVRLWRQPTKSIASSALAYLQETSVGFHIYIYIYIQYMQNRFHSSW
jgi:hypothetical protein